METAPESFATESINDGTEDHLVVNHAAAAAENDEEEDKKPAAVSEDAKPMVVKSTATTARLTQEERRRNRRRLYRLLNNPEVMVPSFLRAIGAEPIVHNLVDSDSEGGESQSNGNKRKRIKQEDLLPKVDENDFLIDPPTVVIDVDEYLGLKRKIKREDDEEDRPDVMMSSSSSQDPRTMNAKSSSTGAASSSVVSMINPASGRNWYEGICAVSMPEDSQYLSEMQLWLRRNLEFFSATDDEANTSKAGRRAPTVRAKVGVRCIHCARNMLQHRKEPDFIDSNTVVNKPTKIAWPAGAVSYPINLAAVYSNCIQKPQTHFEKCPHLPPDSGLAGLLHLQRSNQLSNSGGGGGRKRSRDGMTANNYWLISCRRLGLVETDNGLRFARDPNLPSLPFRRTRAEVEQESLPVSPRGVSISTPDRGKSSYVPMQPTEFPEVAQEVLKETMEEPDDLILREDYNKLSAYIFLTLRQSLLCHAELADFASKGKRTKSLRLGYAGFACKHCSSCRSFASSSENLGAALSNSLVAHLLKCPDAPPRIRQALQVLKKLHSQQMMLLPYGSQSQFFGELWTRLRAADKKADPEQEKLLHEKRARGSFSTKPERVDAPQNSEIGPNDTQSRKPAPLGRRGKRGSLSDSAPILPRGPSFPVANDLETQDVLKNAEDNWDPAENDNLILPEEKNLISDYVFLCIRQLKVAVPSMSDFKSGRRSNLGHMAGFCCIHCANLPGNQSIQTSGRAFLSAPDNMASTFNTSMYNHLLSCPAVPENLKRVFPILRKMHSQQCSSLPFGSQRRFFNRVFKRLQDVPNEQDSRFSEALQESSFVHRTSGVTDEFWQCLRCRMVPFEYRAASSLFFVRPNIEDVQRHATECYGDGTCWELIVVSMKSFNDKYGAGSRLVARDSFCDLVRSVVGSNDDVFPAVMSRLGKEGVTLSDTASSQSLWRRFPSAVDMDQVHKAYAAFKGDLQSEMLPDDFRRCPEILELLQLLNCNFQPMSLPKQNETSLVEPVAAPMPSVPATPLPPLTSSSDDSSRSMSQDGLNATVTRTTKGTLASLSSTSAKFSGGAGGPTASVQLLQEAEQTFSHPVENGQFDDAD